MSWTCSRCEQPQAHETKPTFVPLGRARIGVCPKCAACKHDRKVTPEGRYTFWRCVDCPAEGRVIIVDIGMRMLEPHELLAAQFGTFAADYDLSAARTKTAMVRLIGNSVPPEEVMALVRANIPPAAALQEAA